VNFPIRNKGRLQNNDKGWEKTGHVHNVWIFEYTRYSSLNHIVSIHHPYDQALAAMGEKKSLPPLNLSPSDAIDSSETITSPLHKMSLQFLCSVSNSGQQSDNVEQMMDTGDSEAYSGARPSSSKEESTTFPPKRASTPPRPNNQGKRALPKRPATSPTTTSPYYSGELPDGDKLGFPCPSEGCHKYFSCTTSLKRHQISVHGPKAQCPLCFAPLSAGRTDVVKRHMMNGSCGKRFICPTTSSGSPES